MRHELMMMMMMMMNDPTREPSDPTGEAPVPPPSGRPTPGSTGSTTPSPGVVEELPAGGKPPGPPAESAAGEPGPSPAEAAAPAEGSNTSSEPAAADAEPRPDLVWYVLKVQSGREDTIREALLRRVKIQGLQDYFGKIVVPTEKITEIRNNKKRIVERKTYPGYIMVQMELNEKTWFVVRETPGVGDFVGAHGTPTKMTEAEVNQMLHQEEEKTTTEAPKVRIDVERGDRVKIKDGPFENFEGTVEEVIEGRGLVKVMLIIFNRPTPVDLEYWQVERI
jgi:transcriptional antiterminator NusG